MNPIDTLLSQLENCLDKPLVEYPQLKAILILKEYMLDNHLPIKHIGKIKLDVDGSFFDDEDKAKLVLSKFALVLKRIHDAVVEEFGEDAERVFVDLLESGTGITCKRG